MFTKTYLENTRCTSTIVFSSLVWLGVAFVAAALLIAIPALLYSTSTLGAVAVGIAFLFTLYAVTESSDRALLAASLIWLYLLISQEILHPFSDPDEVRRSGSFDAGSYSEPIVWIFGLMALGVLTVAKPKYLLSDVFGGRYRWAMCMTIFSVMSAVYSPSPSYAFAWSIKLVLVVLLLRFYLTELSTIGELRNFVNVTFWAYVVLTVVPLFRALMNPATLFEGAGGRLNANPSLLSATAGALLLLGLIVHSLNKRRAPLVGAVFGAVVMVAALGKAGIVSGVLGVAVFYSLRKRFAAAIAVTTAVLLVVGVLFVSGGWFANYIDKYKGAETLTGRTAIWEKVIPAMLSPRYLVLGHGYVASKFVSTEVPGEMVVDHLHNAYLDLTFNDGLVGLFFMIALQIGVGRSLWKALRYSRFLRSHAGRDAHIIAAGTIGLLANLLLNGMFNATFGGRVKAAYMTLLGVVVVSEFLRDKTMAMLYAEIAPGTQSLSATD
jgi:O-antigen ligase